MSLCSMTQLLSRLQRVPIGVTNRNSHQKPSLEDAISTLSASSCDGVEPLLSAPFYDGTEPLLSTASCDGVEPSLYA